MRGAVMHGPGEVRVEEREAPQIVEPTDAIIRVSAACVCGSDLWPYRGIGVEESMWPMPMGHEYAGIVEEVGDAVQTVKPLPARAARPDLDPSDRSRQGLRPPAAAGAGGRGLPRDGRARGDQDPAQAMSQTARFAGKVAFVTGASSGIGRATAQALACEGASVVVADVAADGARETARLMEQEGGRALALSCDVP